VGGTTEQFELPLCPYPDSLSVDESRGRRDGRCSRSMIVLQKDRFRQHWGTHRRRQEGNGLAGQKKTAKHSRGGSRRQGDLLSGGGRLFLSEHPAQKVSGRTDKYRIKSRKLFKQQGKSSKRPTSKRKENSPFKGKKKTQKEIVMGQRRHSCHRRRTANRKGRKRGAIQTRGGSSS